MPTKRPKSEARKFLEKLTGGPLTLGRAIRAIRLVTGRIADAALDGIHLREAANLPPVEDEGDEGIEEAEELSAEVALEVTAAAEEAFLGAAEVATPPATAPAEAEAPV